MELCLYLKCDVTNENDDVIKKPSDDLRIRSCLAFSLYEFFGFYSFPLILSWVEVLG